MLKIRLNRLLISVLVVLFFVPFVSLAKDYLGGSLLRAEGDIKVYLINNNIKRWVSSLEVFNFNNFRWHNVKVVPKKEVAAIKEGDPIVLATVSPTPSAIASESPAPSPSVTPAVSVSPVPTPPVKAKINDKLPAPDYITAEWLISRATSNYGRIGQRIVFKYSDKERDRIDNFNLYEKKPGSEYFYKVAGFEEILSTGCEDIDIDGEWMLTEAGQCGYWTIQRVVPPGGRNEIAYHPASDFSVGEYVYYVVGADKDGAETTPSPEAKLVFLDTVEILSPVNDEEVAGIYPIFKWTITNKWPANSTADYFIIISDDANALNSIWTKQLRIPAGETGKEFKYDGLSLNSSRRYKVNIYGHYRNSNNDPDYISIPVNMPEFSIKKPGLSSVFKAFFALLRPFFP